MLWRSSRRIQSGFRWYDRSQGRAIGRWATALHAETEKIVRRMIGRCHYAGIEIVLVSADGQVEVVDP